MTNSFIFYASFYEALSDVEDPTVRLAVYDAIASYALTGREPKLKGTASAMFKLIRPQIDANIRRRENGAKGGKPVTEAKAEDNLTVTEDKPNANLNVTEAKPKRNRSVTKSKPNVNDNVNVNVYLDDDDDITRARVKRSYTDAFGRDATPAELDAITRAVRVCDMQALVDTAISRAARAPARNVSDYVCKVMQKWFCLGIHTEDALTEYELKRAAT